MIRVNQLDASNSEIEEDIYLSTLIRSAVEFVESTEDEDETGFTEQNADEYLKAIFLFLTRNLNKPIITDTNDIVALIHLFFCATEAAEQKNKYFHFYANEKEDKLEFGLVKKEDNIADIRSALEERSNATIN